MALSQSWLACCGIPCTWRRVGAQNVFVEMNESPFPPVETGVGRQADLATSSEPQPACGFSQQKGFTCLSPPFCDKNMGGSIGCPQGLPHTCCHRGWTIRAALPPSSLQRQEAPAHLPCEGGEWGAGGRNTLPLTLPPSVLLFVQSGGGGDIICFLPVTLDLTWGARGWLCFL